jgi:hypothetical protein
MDLEETCSPCGTKLLWKGKIPLVQDTLDRSPANVSLGKQIPDSNLEDFCQIEDLDIEDRANTRLDLCHGYSGDIPATALKLGRKFDLRPTMPIPQLTHLRSYDIAVPHSALRVEEPSRQGLASLHLSSDRRPQNGVEVEHL